MSHLDDRIERDLQYIADGATPSSTAWDAIQTRIDEQADYPELEITMLKPNPKPDNTVRNRVLLAAAAAIVLIVGAFVAFSGGDDDISLRVTETDTSVPATSAAPATTAAPDTTAAPANEGDAAAVALAEEFIDARNAYDGETVLGLFADDAFVRDDLRRDVNGRFLGFDEIDIVFMSEHDRVTEVELVDPACELSSPGRVRCTYTWHSAWTRALGDDRYTGNSFLFDITNGQIDSLTHTFAQGPVDGFEDHISEVQTLWLVDNHPDDLSTMFDGNPFPANSAASLALWEAYTAEFVASAGGAGDAATVAVAEQFIEARIAYDGEAMRALIADDATIARAHEWIDAPDGYLILDDFERASRMQFLDLECTPGSPGRVRCTYSMESDLTRALDVGPYPNSLVFDVTDGLITGVNHNRSTNSEPGDDGFSAQVYFQNFVPWLDDNHPDDLAQMFNPDSVDNVTPPLMTEESIALWEARVPEFVASLAG